MFSCLFINLILKNKKIAKNKNELYDDKIMIRLFFQSSIKYKLFNFYYITIYIYIYIYCHVYLDFDSLFSSKIKFNFLLILRFLS
jgi:hypothetical protein